MDVVKYIQEDVGGRFLERSTTNGGWIVVDDKIARKKVNSSFRSKLAKKEKKQDDDTTTTNNYTYNNNNNTNENAQKLLFPQKPFQGFQGDCFGGVGRKWQCCDLFSIWKGFVNRSDDMFQQVLVKDRKPSFCREPYSFSMQ